VNSTPTSRTLMARRPDRVSERIVRAFECAAIVVALAAPLHAQVTPTPGPTSTSRFETGIVVGGGLASGQRVAPNRDAMHSVDFSVSLRRQPWAFDGGWLRIARNLSTVQGVYVSAGRLLHLGPVLFIPAVGVLGGQAQESRDSTGFDFCGIAGRDRTHAALQLLQFGDGPVEASGSRWSSYLSNDRIPRGGIGVVVRRCAARG